MVEVRLHGPLASFGKVWHLDIATPQEAVRAIECGRKGFRQAILDLADKGMVFRVRSKTHDYGNEDIGLNLGNVERIDIIPIVAGASAGVRFVIGAALVVASFFAGPAQPYLMATGVSMMLGAVTEWLTPVPKREDTSNKSLQSWTISGPSNTADQGTPVPVIYGEVLTGGYAISAGIAASRVNPGGTLSPAVSIGGKKDISSNTGRVGKHTSVFSLSAGPFNLDDPITYAWTVSGFALANAVRVTSANKGTVRIEVDYTMTATSQSIEDTGTASVACTGKYEGNTTTVNKSLGLTVEVNSTLWQYDLVGGGGG